MLHAGGRGRGGVFAIVSTVHGESRRPQPFSLEATIGKLGTRCGGHALAEQVLRCDKVVASTATKNELGACVAHLRTISCKEFARPGWRLPDVCRFEELHIR
jgi:hypothetical protein